jgi:hypothetical protein
MQRKEHGIGDVRRDQRLRQPPDDLLRVACAVDPGVQLCGRFVRVRIARLLGRLAAATAFKTRRSSGAWERLSLLADPQPLALAAKH